MKRKPCKFKSNRQQSEEDSNVDYSSKIIQQFQSYATELEEKQDRYERIIKISRDVTIESKRLIFYLHTYRKEVSESEGILVEAKTRLSNIIKSYFIPIINELKDLDAYQFQKAFCFGVQEFIEAFSFYYYLNYQELLTFEFLGKFLEETLSTSHEFLEKEEFEVSEKCARKQHNEKNLDSKINDTPKHILVDFLSSNSSGRTEQRYFLLLIDYVLGISDLTGELMRYCINQIGSGQMESAFNVSRFLTNLYSAMLSVGCNIREYNRKMYTTIENVRKVEMACYTVKVRGSEMPKHMIVRVLDEDVRADEIPD